MQVTKGQRTLSVFLCLLMVISFFAATAPKAYAAEEPEWPYLKSIDSEGFTFSNAYLRDDFPAPSENLKKLEIQHHSEKKACENAKSTETAPVYDVGTIVLYVETLPTADDKDPTSTAKYCGFKFQIGKTAVDDGQVQFSGDYKTIGNFKAAQYLKVDEDFCSHPSSTYYYIQTEDGTKYHYDVKVVPYTGEEDTEPEWPYLKSIDSEGFTFSNAYLRDDFPAPSENLKKLEIQHHSEKKACENAKDTETAPVYDVGTIVLYVETLPTAEDKDPTSTAKYCGFKFQIGKTAVDDGQVQFSGDYKTIGNFKAAQYLKVDEDFCSHPSSTYYYIQTEDGTKYHYDVKVVQYTGEAGEKLTLRAGSANRDSKEAATIKFSASAEGKYYYALYDQQQPNPVVDTTSANTNTGTMAKTNTITVSGMTDYKAKYLYIVGVDAAGTASDPLEIVIPGMAFELKHEKQDIEYSGPLYTEQFTDSEGNPITAAVPGDTVIVNFGVFEAGSKNMIYEDGTIKSKAGVKQSALKQWNISGLTLDSTPTTPTFQFTMPENDVTIQAETKLVGVPIRVTSGNDNVKITTRCSAYFTNPYELPGGNIGYTVSLCQNQEQTDVVPVSTKVKVSAYDISDGYVLDKWVITSNGSSVDESKITRNEDGSIEITLEEGGNYVFSADLRAQKFASVTAAVNDSTMGSATVAAGGGKADAKLDLVYEGQAVTLTATPGDRYTLKRWDVKEDGEDGQVINVTPDAEDSNKATFIMPATDKNITAKAIFEVDPEKASTECNIMGVKLYSGSTDGAPINQSFDREGTKLTITLPANMDTANLADLILKFTVSNYATIKQKDAIENWPADGKACGMALNTPVTFTVTAEDGKTTQDYTLTITKAKSTEKEIKNGYLMKKADDKTPLATAVVDNTKKTVVFTLPANTDTSKLDEMILKFTVSDYATIKQKDASENWPADGKACSMALDTPVTFTVTAEDGSTKEYTVEIKYTALDVPTLSDGSATRTSKTGATVKFTSNEAGTYFYKVVEHGAAAPTVDTSKNGTAAVKGENAITLSNLTEDARDIYIVVKNASGGESAALKVEIPAYSSSETPDTGNFSISVTTPKGGTLTTNRTKADNGDEIIVTVKPDSGYQMVEGSLTYTLAVDGGETVKITGNRFTMPSCDVSITCKWETASVVSSGITGFSINGVAGTVNSTTNTITITMPRGTDVTKLTPAISTSGVKSLTPGSGETVNFTNSVTYTATMDDGSTRTYIVTVYVDKGTLADQFWDRLTDFYQQVPWWKYAEQQQSSSKYPKYW